MSIFKNKKYIFDGGMGQLLIDKGMITKKNTFGLQQHLLMKT